MMSFRKGLLISTFLLQQQSSITAFLIDMAPKSIVTVCNTSKLTRNSSSPTKLKTSMRRDEQVISTASSIAGNIDAVPLRDPVILFDGVCNFCNAWVDILLRIDTKEKFKFAPLQSAVGRQLLIAIGKEADDISSVVMIQPDLQSFDKSACVLKVVEELGPMAAVASKGAEVLVPQAIRDSIYETVAENRYNLLGKRDECRCGDPKYARRFLL